MYFNEYPDLLDLLDEMLEKFPNIEKDLKMKKASVYKLLGDLESGFKVVDELLEGNPGNKELRSFKAYWYQYMDKKEEALTIFEELIELITPEGTGDRLIITLGLVRFQIQTQNRP